MSDQRDNGIAWTDQTWNPVRGCSRVSAGCEHCYAETQAARFCGEGQPYHGLVRRTERGRAQWTGTVRVVPEHIDDPLRWKRPRRVFVNSMSDLFHEGLANEDIAAVFGVMAASPTHTFQVLTKRAKRMREWFAWVDHGRHVFDWIGEHPTIAGTYPNRHAWPWPLPNVWLGVSCEDQCAFDERAPELAQILAAVRFISFEPLLGPIDTRQSWERGLDELIGGIPPGNERATWLELLGYGSQAWAIVGGESGPNARPCDVAWIRSIVAQCREANVACFVKQLGARAYDGEDGPRCDGEPHEWAWLALTDRKGGDPSEWPEDLRVREFPR